MQSLADPGPRDEKARWIDVVPRGKPVVEGQQDDVVPGSRDLFAAFKVEAMSMPRYLVETQDIGGQLAQVAQGRFAARARRDGPLRAGRQLPVGSTMRSFTSRL